MRSYLARAAPNSSRCELSKGSELGFRGRPERDSNGMAVGGVGPAAQAAPDFVAVPCSAAVLAADVSSARSGATLSLAAGCTYRLTAGLPVISANLNFSGRGATLTRSSAPGMPAFAILQVNDHALTVRT